MSSSSLKSLAWISCHILTGWLKPTQMLSQCQQWLSKKRNIQLRKVSLSLDISLALHTSANMWYQVCEKSETWIQLFEIILQRVWEVCEYMFCILKYSSLIVISTHPLHSQHNWHSSTEPDSDQGRGDLKMLILPLAVAFFSELSLSTNMVHIELPEAEYPGWVPTNSF